MASGLDQLGKLMQLQQMASASKATAYKQQQDRAAALSQQRAYDLDLEKFNLAKSKVDIERTSRENKVRWNQFIAERLGGGKEVEYADVQRDILTRGGAGATEAAKGLEPFMPSISDRPSDLSRMMGMWEEANPEATPQEVYTQAEHIKTIMHDPTVRGEEARAVAEAKGSTEKFYKYSYDINEKALTAEFNNRKVDQMVSLAEEFGTGPGAGLAQKMQEWARVVGIDIKLRGDLAPKQVLAAFTKQMQLEFRNPKGAYGGGAPGALTEKEWGYLMEGILNAETVPEGFRLLADVFKMNNNSYIGIASAVRESGTKDYQEAQKIQAEYFKDNPYVPYKTTDYTKLTVEDLAEMSTEDILKGL